MDTSKAPLYRKTIERAGRFYIYLENLGKMGASVKKFIVITIAFGYNLNSSIQGDTSKNCNFCLPMRAKRPLSYGFSAKNRHVYGLPGGQTGA